MASVLVAKVAVPELRVPVPQSVAPAENATLPVGEVPVTVAVKVNGVPGSDGALPPVKPERRA